MAPPAEHTEDASVIALLLRVVAAATLCLFAGSVAGLVLVGSRPAPPPSVLAPGQLPSSVASGGIGPLGGTLVADYVGRRREALAAASGRRAAVVSFASYRTVPDAKASVGGTQVARLLVALPGGPPIVTSPSPDEELARTASTLTREADEMKALGDTTDDPAFRADYEGAARSLRTQAASAVDPRAELVFAVAVVADTRGLATLARAPGVRLVDVGRTASVPRALRGLRPEESLTAGMPPLRPG